MARGYEVAVGADGRSFEQGLRKDVIKPTEDAARALDDLAESGDDAGRDAARGLERIEDGLKDVDRAADKTGNDSERALGKLESALRDAQQQAGKTERAIDDIGDGGVKGFRKASEAGTEFKDEALSNFSEVTSSFDGSMSSIQDLAQGTLGGLASSGLPGIGIAAGIAAAGVGLIGGAIEGVGEQQERLKEQASEWADAYIEAGAKVLGAAQLTERGLSILNDRQEEVTENAKNWGVAEETALAAMAGSPAALAEVESALNRKAKAAEADARAAAKVAEENGGVLLSETLLQAQVRKGTDALNFQQEAMERGAKTADTYSYFLRDVADQAEGATREVDKFGDTIVTLPDGTQIYIDAETGQATRDVDAIERKVYGIKDKDVTVKYRADTREPDSYKPPVKYGTIIYQSQAGARQRG